MTATQNQQHHDTALFTRILTRMANLTESVEGLNEEMDELRKMLDRMDEGVSGEWIVSRKFVYSIHPGACLMREPGCDGDPTWSVLKFLDGPRIAGSESTSWRMAWVFAAETLKGENAAKPPTHEDMVKEVHPNAGVVEECNSLNGWWLRCVTIDGKPGSKMFSGWVREESAAWENASKVITQAHKQIVRERHEKCCPSITSCAKSDGTSDQYTHEVWVGDNLDKGRSECIGSGQSEFAAWFAAARNCGLASEPVGDAQNPSSIWSSSVPQKDGWYWMNVSMAEWRDGEQPVLIKTERGSRYIMLIGDEQERPPAQFPDALYGPEIIHPEMTL